MFSPTLQTLKDSDSLSHVIKAFEFLETLHSPYCHNCNEEWPVFDDSWPQTGVPWVGAKAGKSETTERSGCKLLELRTISAVPATPQAACKP